MGVFSFVKAGGKKFGSIVGTKPNVSKTKIDKLKSNLNIAKHKTKMSKAKLKSMFPDAHEQIIKDLASRKKRTMTKTLKPKK